MWIKVKRNTPFESGHKNFGSRQLYEFTSKLTEKIGLFQSSIELGLHDGKTTIGKIDVSQWNDYDMKAGVGTPTISKFNMT